MGFLAIAVGLALAAVLFTRGSFKRLARIPIVSAWVLVLALAIQIALEYVPVDRARYDDLGIGLLMFSYALLLGFCLINLSVRGMGVIAIGVTCNALVIGLNLGMPVKSFEGARIDTTVKQQPAKDSDLLQFLGDIIVLPHPPFNESISFGDLILAVGLIDVAFWASRRRRTEAVVAAEDATAVPADAVLATGPALDATTLVEPDAAIGTVAAEEIGPFTFVGQPPVIEPPVEPAPEAPTVAEPEAEAAVLDALPVDLPTAELPLPVEAVMVDDAAPARRPALSLPGPVEEKAKQPVWDPNRTAPVPTINAAPAHAEPAPPADGSPAPEVAPAELPEPGAEAPAAASEDPSDSSVRTLWSAENGRADAGPAAAAAANPVTPSPEPNGEAATGELEGRRRRQGRRRRGTPQASAPDPHETHEIDLSAFEVRSDADADAARRAR